MPVSIDELVVGDTAEAWALAGFAPDDDVVVLGNVRVRLAGRDAGRGIAGWSLRGVTEPSLDGLATRHGGGDRPEPGIHPNGSLAIDHVVLMTPDPRRTTAALEEVGLAARRTRRTESYGAPMSQTFFKADDVIVELVGPQEPADDPSPAAFFGLAITVDDLDATAALLGERLGSPKDAVQQGRRIATLRHKDCGMSVPTAFMSR